eukprot:1154731-Pelagomonas_calceolata.AAC.9
MSSGALEWLLEAVGQSRQKTALLHPILIRTMLVNTKVQLPQFMPSHSSTHAQKASTAPKPQSRRQVVSVEANKRVQKKAK